MRSIIFVRVYVFESRCVLALGPSACSVSPVYGEGAAPCLCHVQPRPIHWNFALCVSVATAANVSNDAEQTAVSLGTCVGKVN